MEGKGPPSTAKRYRTPSQLSSRRQSTKRRGHSSSSTHSSKFRSRSRSAPPSRSSSKKSRHSKSSSSSSKQKSSSKRARVSKSKSLPRSPRGAPLVRTNSSRFIPNRLTGKYEASDVFHHHMPKGKGVVVDPLAPAVLTFDEKPPENKEEFVGAFQGIFTAPIPVEAMRQSSKTRRFISTSAERILDAPDMLDDFYLNLLSWSSSQQLAVGLGDTVYLWDVASAGIKTVTELENYEDYITSVKFVNGTHLAVGISDCDVQLWDLSGEFRQVRSLRSHSSRVGSLAWTEANPHCLATGSQDCTIHIHDIRIRNHHVATLQGHEQEICGLKWSIDGSRLASGGNDNICCIWDYSDITNAISNNSLSSGTPIISPKHKITDSNSAVKALAWCPWQKELLAVGGGTADRHIRFYNAITGACTKSVDAQSQVCGLLWNPHARELLSAHGFSQYQLTLWKYPAMSKITELRGHTQRLLHLEMDPTGTTVVSGAADETLRFWKVFEAPKKKPSKKRSHDQFRPMMLR